MKSASRERRIGRSPGAAFRIHGMTRTAKWRRAHIYDPAVLAQLGITLDAAPKLDGSVIGRIPAVRPRLAEALNGLEPHAN